MKLSRLTLADQAKFADLPESSMDLHLAISQKDDFYLVIGCRVAVLLNAETYTEPANDYLDQSWLSPSLSMEQREQDFSNWLMALSDAPPLDAATAAQAWASYWGGFGPVIPSGNLPPAPPPPPVIYGHNPFSTRTLPQTVIYRWEAYPTSRRIDMKANPPTIAKDTYAAPASEAPFIPTGFAAVARFALPNLMPACFRYELQPVVGTSLQCGSVVPLFGQSGGGVEVKFTAHTNNRCMIANPIVLPAL